MTWQTETPLDRWSRKGDNGHVFDLLSLPTSFGQAEGELHHQKGHNESVMTLGTTATTMTPESLHEGIETSFDPKRKKKEVYNQLGR